MPALVAVVNPSDEFWTVEYLAPALWVMGFAGESTADRQGLHFRLDSHNRGRTCQLGLWRYSRHPNYFFEFVDLTPGQIRNTSGTQRADEELCGNSEAMAVGTHRS